jgi:hypothetical protein
VATVDERLDDQAKCYKARIGKEKALDQSGSPPPLPSLAHATKSSATSPSRRTVNATPAIFHQRPASGPNRERTSRRSPVMFAA